MSQQFKIPGGRERDVPLAEAKMESLTYWAQRIGTALDRGESRFPDRDKKLHAALCAEIARREGGGQQAPAQSQQQAPAIGGGTAIATTKADELAGSYTKPEQVTAMLRAAQKIAHLVTPQTSCGALPEGCCIASSVVLVDVDNDTYGVGGGDIALDKTALDKISAAAGIDWDPVLSCRLDNGRNPHYVHYRAVGYVRNFDGTRRTLPGNVEIDLRDGASGVAEMKPGELAIARKFILRLAESKAMNRAIRRLGIASSYTRRELDKPFVVTKIMFTGQTDDPKLRTLFAGKIADAFTGGHAALYSGERHPTPAMHPQTRALPPAPTPGHEPPPVGQSAGDDDWGDYPDEPEQLPASTGAVPVSELAQPGEGATAVPVAGEQTGMKL
jgi:hypothetical protein